MTCSRLRPPVSIEVMVAPAMLDEAIAAWTVTRAPEEVLGYGLASVPVEIVDTQTDETGTSTASPSG